MPPSFEEALRTVHLEALHLDQRRWREWLSLYTENCTFWVPAWRDETTQVEDPGAEISFIHAGSRRVLEERVDRLAGGKSLTTFPPHRTVHCITGGTELPASAPDRRRVSTAWTNHIYDPRLRTHKVLFGHYEHEFVTLAPGEVRIAAKKVVLANDQVETVLDIYSV